MEEGEGEAVSTDKSLPYAFVGNYLSSFLMVEHGREVCAESNGPMP